MITPYTGNEPGTPDNDLSGTFFTFEAQIIRRLLRRTGALGIRLHFDQARPNQPTALYAAACAAVDDIMDTDTVIQDYFKSDGSGVAFANLPASVKSNFMPGEKAAGCVFMSRTILENILGPESDPFPIAKVVFAVKTLSINDRRGIPCLTLVAAGLTIDNNPAGVILRSEQPCPPNCPTDPDTPYGHR